MSSSKNLVPEAKAALDQFKMEAASEVGVNLTNGCNGDLTSVPGRFVGGQMVYIIILSHKKTYSSTLHLFSISSEKRSFKCCDNKESSHIF